MGLFRFVFNTFRCGYSESQTLPSRSFLYIRDRASRLFREERKMMGSRMPNGDSASEGAVKGRGGKGRYILFARWVSTPHGGCGPCWKYPKQWKPHVLYCDPQPRLPLWLNLSPEWKSHIVAVVWVPRGAAGLGKSPHGAWGSRGWIQKAVGGRREVSRGRASNPTEIGTGSIG